MTPDRDLTAALLSARERREEASEAPRRYLGASVIGHPCDRFLWMHFRGIHRERFDGRMLRLFDRGQREEAVFIQELRWIGAEVLDRDPSTGAQWAVEAYGGHIRGHLDAAAQKIPGANLEGWHVCEFKTHNDKSFKDLVRKGVRDAKPMHYAQMQIYMGLTGMRHALYLAVDKNDDTLHAERVDFDETLFDTLMRRARAVIDGTASDRVSDRADDWRCKACPASALCFPGPDAAVFPCDDPPDCRSCCHAAADTDRPGANWTCALALPMTIGAPTECRAHQPWPDAMPGVETIDEDPASGTLRIRLAGAQEIAEIGPEPGQFSGPELAKLPRAALRAASAAKAAFAGAEIKQTRGLIDNWTLDGWGVEVWKGDPSGVAAALASFGVDPARILASDEAHHIQAWQYRGAEAVEYLVMLDPRRNRARILKARF